MNTYRIARRGTRYNVIEELPDNATFEIGGFPTQYDAQLWLDDRLRVLERNQRREAEDRSNW